MSVLMLADEQDVTADGMVRALHDRDAVVHRVDTAWFPEQLSVSAELREGRWSGHLRMPHRVVDLDGITSVWFRSPSAYRFPAGMSRAERSWANLEAKYGLGGVLTSLPVLWINHPARLADAAYKPVQMAVAHRCGLTVPPTMITNEPGSVRAFASGGKTITKTLGSNSIVEAGGRKVGYTRLLDDADLADLSNVNLTTHQFQRWAPKQFDARVIAVGGNVTTVAIEATSAEAYVDFRRDYQQHRYELIELPQDVHMRVMALMRELDLVYGALDFVVGPDGSWTFLEINAGGQYGWLEDQGLDISITDQLADLLAKGAL